MLTTRTAKLKKELKEFQQSLQNESRWAIKNDEDRLNVINVLIFGPPNTPYEGGTFEVEIEFPRRYPLEAPELEMKTKIFHPMINEKGIICLAILENWNFENKFINCLENICDGLRNPQAYLAGAINDEALCLCIDKPQRFKTKAREYTEKFAMVKVSSVV